MIIRTIIWKMFLIFNPVQHLGFVGGFGEEIRPSPLDLVNSPKTITARPSVLFEFY